MSLLGRYGEVVEIRAPFPWTMLLVASARVSSTTTAPPAAAGRPGAVADGRGGTGRPAAAVVRLRRADPVDRDRLDRDLHLRLPGHRQPRAGPGRLQPDLALLGDHVRDPVGDLPADRAAALAHDRRPPGPRAARPLAARPGRDPVRLRAAVPDRRAGAAPPDRAGHVRRLGRAVLDPRHRRAGLRRQLLRPRLAGRPPALRAVRRARVPGVDLALPVPAGGGGRDRLRPGGRRPRDGGGAVRVAVGDAVRLSPDPRRARRPAERTPRSPPTPPPARGRPRPRSRRPTPDCRCATAPASRSRWSGSCSPSRR